MHHYKTMQCPKSGEAQVGKKQEWLGSIYMPDITETIEKRVDRLEKRIKHLEEIIRKAGLCEVRKWKGNIQKKN